MEPNLSSFIDSLPCSMHGYLFQLCIGNSSSYCLVKSTQIKTGHDFAAKVIYTDPKDEKALKMAQKEFSIYTSLLHPNIIKIYDAFREGDFYILILEYCSNGSIEDIIKNGHIPCYIHALTIMKQLLCAVDYCHSQNITHSDIRPKNILIANNNYIKLSNFEFGLKMNESQTTETFSESLDFKAPELIKKEEYDPYKADLWSLGVTFYFIATGELPWGKEKKEIERNIISGNYKSMDNVSPEISSVIEKLLVVDPKKRESTKDLLKEECFATLDLHSMAYSIRKPTESLNFRSFRKSNCHQKNECSFKRFSPKIRKNETKL